MRSQRERNILDRVTYCLKFVGDSDLRYVPTLHTVRLGIAVAAGWCPKYL